jgi:hypothetical protein
MAVATAPVQTARKGDIILVERTSSYTKANYDVVSSQKYTVGVVTATTRVGLVKAYRPTSAPEGTKFYVGEFNKYDHCVTQWWIAKAADVDVPALLAACDAREYRDATFSTQAEAVAFVRQFKAGQPVTPQVAPGTPQVASGVTRCPHTCGRCGADLAHDLPAGTACELPAPVTCPACWRWYTDPSTEAPMQPERASHSHRCHRCHVRYQHDYACFGGHYRMCDACTAKAVEANRQGLAALRAKEAAMQPETPPAPVYISSEHSPDGPIRHILGYMAEAAGYPVVKAHHEAMINVTEYRDYLRITRIDDGRDAVIRKPFDADEYLKALATLAIPTPPTTPDGPPRCAQCQQVIVAEAGDTCASIPVWQRGAFTYCDTEAPRYTPAPSPTGVATRYYATVKREGNALISARLWLHDKQTDAIVGTFWHTSAGYLEWDTGAAGEANWGMMQTAGEALEAWCPCNEHSDRRAYAELARRGLPSMAGGSSDAPAHTPGPWRKTAGMIQAPGHGVVAVYTGGPGSCVRYVGADQAEANARLIAAAPIMLDALITIAHDLGALLPTIRDQAVWDEVYNCAAYANDALASAKGV